MMLNTTALIIVLMLFRVVALATGSIILFGVIFFWSSVDFHSFTVLEFFSTLMSMYIALIPVKITKYKVIRASTFVALIASILYSGIVFYDYLNSKLSLDALQWVVVNCLAVMAVYFCQFLLRKNKQSE
jgi:hypothetical protein